MIRVPSRMLPSQFLCLDDLPRFVHELLETSCSLRLQRRVAEAEQHAREALDATRDAGGRLSRAAALIHLSDVHVTEGKLSKAMGEARKAHRLFASQPSRYQRHNEAVAAYAIGVLHQSLGSRADALRWYQRADDLLERVSIDWAAVDDSSNLDRCDRARKWIRALIEALTHTPRSSDDPIAALWFPVILSEEESDVTLAQLEVERYVVAGTLRVGGKSFRLELPQGQSRLSLHADAEYYALEVPDEALNTLGADEGDYALIVRQRSPAREGPGVLESMSGAEFGRFKRDQWGNVHFVRTDATVIGSKDIGDDLTVGYVAALLKQKPT